VGLPEEAQVARHDGGMGSRTWIIDCADRRAVSGASVRFEHISGRHAETRDLPRLAALLGEPAAFYKDSNPRNFLITGDGTIFAVDTDDLTLAPFGYDLAKLIATLTMTYGEIGPAGIETAREIYNRAAARHDATTRERLDNFLAPRRADRPACRR
jgi:hypothetical protein